MMPRSFSIGDPSCDSPEELRSVLESGLSGTLIVGSSSALATPVREVRMLGDGRVGGISAAEGNAFFIILEQLDGTWLIDDVIDVIDE